MRRAKSNTTTEVLSSKRRATVLSKSEIEEKRPAVITAKNLVEAGAGLLPL